MSAQLSNLGSDLSTANSALIGLPRALVQAARISPEQADEWLRGARFGATFLSEVLGAGVLDARQVAEFASNTFALPLLDLDAIDIDGLPISLVDRKIIVNRHVLPLRRRGNRLSLAMADPTDTAALDEVKFQTSLAIDPVVVEYNKITSIIERFLKQRDTRTAAALHDQLASDLGHADEPIADAVVTQTNDADDAPVVRFIKNVITEALTHGASDIHFEPYEKFYRIRIRVDGELRALTAPPLTMRDRIASRLKIISRMDIAEKRAPQDGRFRLAVGSNRTVEFRVSSLPTVHGEKMVLRILDTSGDRLNIDALGYDAAQRQAVLNAIARPYGMILVTGPTGSGKTVSLYSFLNLVNKPGKNIATVEDPAEISLPGANQVSVNDKAGLTFATALRAFLRQDPDIIMVGEIRDAETAQIAVKAAQTGHLVLSTLHTNDAPATLTRLAAMGVAQFNLASSVILITAQRLIRRLCRCKSAVNLSEAALLAAGFMADEIDGSWTPYAPVGCDRCNSSGFKGRIGIFQVVPISDEITRLLMRGASEIEIADESRRAGNTDLRQAGLSKVKAGLTSIEEVMAVTNEK